MLPDLQWSTYGHKFNDEMRILALGGCDAVLGVEWLKKYSPVVFSFNQLSLTSTKDGKSITLKGITEEPELRMTSSGLQKVFKKKIGKLMGFLISITAESTNQVCLSLLSFSLIREFTDIFDEPKGLSPIRTHDHHIPLLP